MRVPTTEATIEGPNMTPVIDVVFLLLIFFLVATRFDQEERELKIELPDVVQAQPLAMIPEIVINVTTDGKYKVLSKEYTEDELLAVLQESKNKNPNQSVLIRAGGDTAWKYGVRVMGICNRCGIDNYRVAALERN
jgi:biopolymer transport protein ExbD